jgi:hypothetical protein
MKLQEIVNSLNELLAGERHSYAQLKRFLDRTIDDINQQLNSTFPAFSEMPEGKAEYDYFPDRYIRSVVLQGAAWYYFTTDEEGNQTAPQYMMNYERALYYMLRDHFNSVPEEYQATDLTPLVENSTLVHGERGVSVDVRNILP